MEILVAVSTVVTLLTLVVCANLSSWLSQAQRQLNQLLRFHGVAPAAGELSERVKELALDPARKIEAIKAFREETGAGLAEAKAAIETHARSHQG